MDAYIGKNLSAASTDPSLAITNQPSDFFTIEQLQHPPTRGDQQNPQKNELREKHAARQRRYRERQRNEKDDINKQLTATAAEIENALVERDDILAQQTVLSKAIHYCSSVVRAAQTLVSSTFGQARSHFRSSIDVFPWLDLHTPSDAQLHAFIDIRSADELEAVSLNVMKRSVDLLLRYDAEPEAREKIEAQVERIRTSRLRTIKHLFNTRPEIIVDLSRRRIMPLGPDGAPNPKLVEAVAALNLTPEQVDSFEQEWILYRQNTESLRQEVRSLISFLTSATTEDNIAYFSFGAADLFINRLQAVQELELHPSKETQAIITLCFWLPNNLTMAQKAILMKHSMPYLPDPIQFGRILLGEDSGITTHSERVRISQTHPVVF